MRIRQRTVDDWGGLLEVAGRVREVDGYPAFLPGNDLHRFLTVPAALAAWIGEADGRVVGHVALNAESHSAVMAVVRRAGITGELGVVARLLVDPPARRQGLGRCLLEQARAGAIDRGRLPVLDVVATATAAISLYRASGWEELGRCRLSIPGHGPVEEIVFAAPSVG